MACQTCEIGDVGLLQESAALLEEAQASLDDVVFGDPFSAFVTPLKPNFDCPQDSAALLEEAQVSLDAVVFGDPILAPATLAALLDYAANEMSLPLEAATAVSVLTDIQVPS